MKIDANAGGTVDWYARLEVDPVQGTGGCQLYQQHFCNMSAGVTTQQVHKQLMRWQRTQLAYSIRFYGQLLFLTVEAHHSIRAQA